MNANDARIVRLFTAQVDGTVEDNTPNANAQVPDQFDPRSAGSSATAGPTTPSPSPPSTTTW
jgi:Flp pilus assembly CpaF family ATPase